MDNFVTKEDLKEEFDIFALRIKQEHEARIQMISGHYSDVLKSNQELKARVCGANKEITAKLDTLIAQMEPYIKARTFVDIIHSTLKWFGVPFTLVGFAVYWVWSKL